MQITGIVCEYNPLHRGHQKQIDYLHRKSHAVVCLMSGNFVQRGHPAIFDKMARVEAALACGADLVIELPISYAISSAEGFAAGGVEILSKICDNICFGAESTDGLMDTAALLLSPAFSEKLRIHLDAGLSFPAARATAVEDCGGNADILATPNNILAVEYCKAILAQNSHLKPLVIHRQGSYHDTLPDEENPSATALRALLEGGLDWQDYVPAAAVPIFEAADIHSLRQGEKAILYRLRTMTDGEFEALPYGSEGLWRKLMHAARSCQDLEAIIAATKSKRYTRSRIDRMILCAYLGITREMLSSPAPYARVLGFNDIGRGILGHVKESGYFINIGHRTGSDFEQLEYRAVSLYGLFTSTTQIPEAEQKHRVCYRKQA